MTLRQRLLFLVMVVLGVSLVIGAAITYWRAASKVQTELHAAFVVGQQVLVDAAKEIDRAPNPFQQLHNVIERFSGGRHLKVSLIDASGNVAMSSRLAQPEDPAPEWFYTLLGSETESVSVALPQKVSGYTSFLIETISRNEVHEFWEDLVSSLLVMAILGTLVLALIYWTMGRELLPLVALNQAFKHISDGNFHSRLNVAGPKDLQLVSVGFNQMAERLEHMEAVADRLHNQLESVQEEERAELARDLHDEIGPLLFSVGIDTASVQKALGESASHDVVERLESIREAVSLSQKHVLQILGRLRSGSVEDLGLDGAIQRLIDFWRMRQPHLEFSAEIPDTSFGADLDTVIFRVVQESVSNAVRHGQPTHIDIIILQRPDGSTSVTVVDDGGGLKSDKPGNGQTGMRERVTTRNGTLVIRNRNDGRGTLVTADFPSSHAPETEKLASKQYETAL